MLHKQLQHTSCEKLCPLNITTYCCTSLLNWKYSTIMSFVLFWFVLTLSNVSIRHVLLCHRNLLTLDTWYGRCPEQYRLYQRLTSTDNASCRVASCCITTRSMITLHTWITGRASMFPLPEGKPKRRGFRMIEHQEAPSIGHRSSGQRSSGNTDEL